MAIVQIPVDPFQPDHQFSIALDGVIYILAFQLNSRSKRWFMTIKQEDGTILVSGVALVISYSLLDRFKKAGMPPGNFFVFDDSGLDREVTEDSFQGTHSLVYVEEGTPIDE